MQLLSLAALGPEAQRLLDDLAKNLPQNSAAQFITFAAITFGLWIVAAWIASQAVLRENTGFGNAFATGVRWFFSLLFAAALAGGAFYFARLRGSASMATASLGIGAILAIYSAVSAPIGVYKIPLGKGIAFAVIGVIVHLAAQVAVQKAMGDPLQISARIDQARRLAALPAEDASEVLTSLKKGGSSPTAAAVPATPAPVAIKPAQATPAPAPAAPPKPKGKTIAERHDDLKKIYADLMAQRESLREGDDAAIAAYERNSAAYAEKLAQLQKDKDAGQK